MKKNFVIIAFFYGFGLFGQSYTPLIGNSNEWQFTTCYFGCITDIYYTNGDTVVDGKNYKILDGYHFISRSFLIREEINTRKIYLKITAPQPLDEVVLYDFSMAEGDSIQMVNPISPFPPNGGYFLLDSIRFLPLADGQNYRHFYFSPTASNTQSTENAVWVEGVGSLSMINAPGGYPNINEVGHLSCSFKNMELRYSNLDSIKACIPVHLNVNDFIQVSNKVEIFAQSEKNHFLLTPGVNIRSVTIFDLSGKQLKNLNYTSQNQIFIDLSDLKPGIYILKAGMLNAKAQTFKLVIK